MAEETEVITPEVKTEEVATGIEAAAETAAAIEERFGSKEKAEEIRSKAKQKKEDKPAGEKKPEAKTITTEQGEELKPKKVETTSDKKDDKEFFDPFTSNEQKPADTKEKTISSDGKETTTAKEEKVVSAVEKSKEDLERDAQFTPLKEFHDKYKPVVEHPLVAAILDSGLPVIDALIKIQPKDYSIKSEDPKEQDTIDEWRAKEYFSTVENLKDKDLADAVDEYLSMDEGISKRRERSAQITALNAAQANRIDSLTKESTAKEERKAANLSKLDNDINNFIASTTEKGNLFGMQLADGKAKILEDGLKGFFKELFNSDGSVNLKPIVSAVYFEKFHKEAMREKIKKVESRSKQEVLEDVVQLDENNQSVTNRRPASVDDLEKQINEKYGTK